MQESSAIIVNMIWIGGPEKSCYWSLRRCECGNIERKAEEN
jgi:hypothetical protein